MKELSHPFQISTKSASIYSFENLLNDQFLTDYLKKSSRKILVITDKTVFNLYGLKLYHMLKSAQLDIEIYPIEEGETFKTRQTKQDIEDFMLSRQFLKQSLIVALGGGVIHDLAGFVAATYMRSIPFISIPTTLLCAVDACLGGKTGVNTCYGKNLIGCFHEPQAIFIDTTTFSTCSKKDRLNGLAEIIKIALIQNDSFFFRLENSLDLWNHFHCEFIQDIMTTAQKGKIDIIEKDPKELSVRKILNFGHTIGHALERACDYHLSHGEAISIGMIVESYLSYTLNNLSEKDYLRIFHLFKSFRFPLKLPQNFDQEKFLKAIALDKKNRSQEIAFVILKKIGAIQPFNGIYTSFFPLKAMKQLCQFMERHFI